MIRVVLAAKTILKKISHSVNYTWITLRLSVQEIVINMFIEYRST